MTAREGSAYSPRRRQFSFLFTESINILTMVILGGTGIGEVLGAAILVALPEIFGELQAYRLLAFGVLLMVLMIFRPEGLVPLHAGRKPPETAPAAPDEEAAAPA